MWEQDLLRPAPRMRRLSNSHEFHFTDWSPELPARVRRAASDVEVSVQLHRDGTQVTVVRHTVADGGDRRTVGIDAVIR